MGWGKPALGPLSCEQALPPPHKRTQCFGGTSCPQLPTALGTLPLRTEDTMLWVTRRCIRVNRTATGWLVRRFVDPAATFRFIEPADVAVVERSDRAIGFDAPGARYPHKDGKGRCSFEALVEEYRSTDRALRALARIVHDADFPDDARSRPAARRLSAFDVVSLLAGPGAGAVSPVAEASGLRAISSGFQLVSADDHETLQRAAFLYDALYASLAHRLALNR